MKWLSRRVLEFMGWTFIGALPDNPKVVVVGFPHTSNWDFFVYLAVMDHLGVRSKFLAKQGLFKGPLRWLLKRWGGIPVDRTGGAALVDTAVASFSSHDTMVLVLAPEGTRGKTTQWKSGFWRIADRAGVPVVMGFVDGKTKTAGLGLSAMVDGEPEAWMEMAAGFYSDKHGLKPQNRGPVAL